tara:strand:- start:6268 stop:6459 length:192 start_codon:yes stop_codon:yes gene_type:complete
MGVIQKYLGKEYKKCSMCKESKFTDQWLWVGHITREELIVCTKCAERETGKKSWKEKSQRIKK